MEINELFRTKPPRGGLWRYEHPISGTRFTSPNLGAIKESIWRHEEANGYPHTSDKAIEDRLCAEHPVCCGETQPNILEKASNFAGALVQWAREGFAVTTEDELQRRLDICRSCEWFKGIAGGSLFHGLCGKCGCSNLKLNMASEHCPISRW